MKITADLIQNSPSFINAVKDRELDLRGNKINQIENLGATKAARLFVVTDAVPILCPFCPPRGKPQLVPSRAASAFPLPRRLHVAGNANDLNDCIDFSDNDLHFLGNFPLLPRLHVILASNNRIQKLDASLGDFLPNLTALVLTNNSIAELEDLTALRSLSKLVHLSLLDNPVSKKPHYREWVTYNLPKLRVLDFQKIGDKVGPVTLCRETIFSASSEEEAEPAVQAVSSAAGAAAGGHTTPRCILARDE
ncbi:MAG: leucine-rich repeat-domain-containing protein, partial [Olpidium bornovanus]